jgi:ribosomal protein S12 methylthiotransferase
MKVGVVSLGCAKNRVDTEHMLHLLVQDGFLLTSQPEEADVLVVNTCGFIEPAKEESIRTILELAEYKETGKCRVLCVTGCLTQRYGQEIASDMPEIDVLTGISSYEQLPGLIRKALDGTRGPGYHTACAA